MKRKMTIEEFNEMMQSTQDENEMVQMLRQITKEAKPEQINLEEGFEGGGQGAWYGWGY